MDTDLDVCNLNFAFWGIESSFLLEIDKNS